jgi:hypothetical protein
MSIPHQVFYYWGYGTRMTYLRYLSLASFRHHHPNWEMYIYQSDWSKGAWNFHEFASRSKAKRHDYSEEAKNVLGVKFETYQPTDKVVLQMPPPNISDIFSYDILARNGGWYSDMDVIWTKNLDRVSDQDYAFIGFGNLRDWVGVFGAVQGSWVMKSFYEPCVRNWSPDSYNSTGTYGIIQACSGSLEWQQKFEAGDRGMKNWRAPADMFYPVEPWRSEVLWTAAWEHSQAHTYSVHLYGGNADYAMANRKISAPSYINDYSHKEWVCRYVRSLDRHLCLLDMPDPVEPLQPKMPAYKDISLPDMPEPVLVTKESYDRNDTAHFRPEPNPTTEAIVELLSQIARTGETPLDAGGQRGGHGDAGPADKAAADPAGAGERAEDASVEVLQPGLPDQPVEGEAR